MPSLSNLLRANRFLILFWVAAAILIHLVTSTYLDRVRVRLERNFEENLSALVDLYRQSVITWHRERLGDLQVLADSPTVATLLETAATRSSLTLEQLEQGPRMLRILDIVCEAYGFLGAYVTDQTAERWLSSTGALPLHQEMYGAARRAAAGDAGLYEVHIDSELTPHVTFSAPVAGPEGSALPALGAVLYATPLYEPDPVLLVHALPQYESVEILLAERRPEGIHFLAPLRKMAGSAAGHLVEDYPEELAMNLALAAADTFGWFVDYAGDPILATARFIEPLGWGVVIKIDHDEALAPWLTNRWGVLLNGISIWLALVGISLGATYLLRAARMRARIEHDRRFRMLFDNNPQPMWVYDLETFRFLEVNEAAIHDYGYSRDEFLKMSLLDIRPEEDIPTLLEHLKESRAELQRSGEWRHRTREGEIRLVEITSHRLNWQGRPASLVVARDLTDRRRLEEQLREAQKMEAIGQLAGGIAHDFNNLVTAIMGYSEMAAARLSEPEAAARNLEQINKAAERAASLTRQLLAFSRRQIMQPRLIDLNTILTDIGPMLHRLIGEDIDLKTQDAPGLGCVLADPGQIEQVIMNLVVNARDALPGGGRITLETAEVELDREYAAANSEVTPGSYVRLSVSDNGTGMDQETVNRAFEPFFTTKEKEKGTGLGLPTVYGIVKQSGGHIKIYSEPGKGTSVKIYLPLVPGKPDQVLPGRRAAEVAGGIERVLVVEDDKPLRHLAVNVLKALGYTVFDAEDGSAAIRTASELKTPVDLLLTDVVMPGMSGRELAERMDQFWPGLKVLYMSGYTDNAIVHHGVLEEGLAFLQKPFTPATLAQAVRKILDDRPGGSGA